LAGLNRIYDPTCCTCIRQSLCKAMNDQRTWPCVHRSICSHTERWKIKWGRESLSCQRTWSTCAEGQVCCFAVEFVKQMIFSCKFSTHFHYCIIMSYRDGRECTVYWKDKVIENTDCSYLEIETKRFIVKWEWRFIVITLQGLEKYIFMKQMNYIN
jgi:hypothetical protein